MDPRLQEGGARQCMQILAMPAIQLTTLPNYHDCLAFCHFMAAKRSNLTCVYFAFGSIYNVVMR